MTEEKLAILQTNDPEWLAVITPYNRQFVEFFKINIEPRFRQPVYNENGKFVHWRVHRVCLEDIIKLIEDFFPGQEIESDLVEDEGSWIEEMFRVIPDGKVDLVYRALAQALHPDLGGDEELMKKLNTAYQARKAGG